MVYSWMYQTNTISCDFMLVDLSKWIGNNPEGVALISETLVTWCLLTYSKGCKMHFSGSVCNNARIDSIIRKERLSTTFLSAHYLRSAFCIPWSTLPLLNHSFNASFVYRKSNWNRASWNIAYILVTSTPPYLLLCSDTNPLLSHRHLYIIVVDFIQKKLTLIFKK